MTAVDRYLAGTAGRAALAEASPERAAKALRVSGDSGINPGLINTDIEAYSETVAAQERAATVRGSPVLQQYITGVPLAAEVSADDYPALIRVADATKAIGIGRYGPQYQKYREELHKELSDARERVRMGEGSFWDRVTVDANIGAAAFGVPGSILKSIGQGIIQGGLYVSKIYKGEPSISSDVLPGHDADELANLVLLILGINGGGPRFSNEVFIKPSVTEFLDNAKKFGPPRPPLRPWHVGTQRAIESPEALQFRHEQNQILAAQRAAGVDAVYKALAETKTRERAPAEAQAFVRQQVGDETIRIPAEAAQRAYGEAGVVPAAGDEVLGFQADIAAQIERRLADGGDVEIPLDRYLARVAEDVHGALLKDLRVGGEDTVNEAKEAGKAGIDESTVDTAIPEPSDITLEKVYDDASGTAYNIKRGEETLGGFVIKQEETNLRIEDIFSDAAKPLNAKALRQAKNELAKLYPEAKTLSGRRITGARSEKPEAEQEVKITLAPEPGPLSSETEPARKDLFLNPLFEDAKAAGMTKPEFKDYGKQLEAHVQEVNEAQRALLEREQGKRLTEEWKDVLAEETRRATEEFDARKDVIAEATLRASGVKLATEADVPRGLADKKGAEPDDVADMLGYRTGEELVNDLVALKADRHLLSPADYRTKFIAQSADVATEYRLGEIEQRIEDEAARLLTSEPISRLLYDDLRVMRMQNEGELSAPLGYEELRQKAHDDVHQLETVKDAKDLPRWFRAVKNSGREAENALRKGDIVRAFRAKNQQMMAVLKAHEITKLIKEFRSADKLITRFAQREKNPTVDQDYTNRIQQILVQHGVKVKRGLENLNDALKGAGTLESFVNDKMEEGHELAIDAKLFEPSGRTTQEMIVEDFLNMVKSLRNLDHVGRREKMVVRGQQKELFEAVKAAAIERIERLPPRNPGRRGILPGVKSFIYHADAMFVELERVLHELDDRDLFGPINQYVLRVLVDAKALQDHWFEWAGKRWQELPKLQGMGRRVPNDFVNSVDADGGTFNLTRADVVGIALHMGNDWNFEVVTRTLMPDNAPDIISPNLAAAQIRVENFVKKVLTKEEWDYVQGVWDILRDIKPEIDTMYIRMSGVAPDTVPGRTVETPFGPRRGGYVPIVHDGMFAGTRIKTEKALFEYDYHRATTPNKYTVSRTKGFDRMQIVGYNNALQLRIREMIHDISHREAITQARKLLEDRDIRNAIVKHYGPEYEQQIPYWLQSIANRYNAEDRINHFASSIFRGARKNFIIAHLGLNINSIATPHAGPLVMDLTTYPIQTTGILFDLVKSAALTPLEASHIMKHYDRYWDFAKKHSAELRHQAENYDRDIRTVMEDMLGEKNPAIRVRNTLQRGAMYPLAMIHQSLGMISWIGVYQREMKKGLSHADAVFVAERTLKDWFGSSGAMNLPHLLQGSEFKKIWTVFGGYISKMYNGTRDAVQLGRRGVRLLKAGDPAGAARDFFHAYAQFVRWFVIPTIFGVVFYSPDLWDDEDSWAENVVRGVGSSVAQFFPLIKDIFSKEVQGYPLRGAILTEMTDEVIGAAEDYISDNDDKWIQHTMLAAGYVSGLPLGQIGRSAQFMWNWGHNYDHVGTPWDFVVGLTRGKTHFKDERRSR